MNITWIGSPNHYAGRRGYRVTRITLHIMAGWLAGTDNIFQRASYQASSTYGVGGNGETHQYVAETDAAWADGSYTSNCQTISIEHQGGLDFIPCTQACLDASARLCADIARRYGFGKLERGRNIFLHRDVPPYAHPACPDLCPNGLNWRYIINKANQINGYGDIDMATAAEIWGYNYNKSALGGNMYNAINYELPGRISDVKKAVTALQATVAAQQRQIDKLTTALGSNPEDIADRTAKAVSDKIDKLVITMTAQEKDTAK